MSDLVSRLETFVIVFLLSGEVSLIMNFKLLLFFFLKLFSREVFSFSIIFVTKLN